MDIPYEEERSKQCFKLPHEVFGNLNIKYNESSAITVFWNKYQIFVYDDVMFETPKTFIPDFNIENILISNNYLICLDDNGNIHITPLKFKHSKSKNFKSSFQPREQGIKCIEQFNNVNTISIKYVSNSFYLCTHKINSDFQIDNEIKILFDGLPLLQQQTKPWIFLTYFINSTEYDQIKDLYKQKDTWKEHAIILISFDRISVFSILYSSKTLDQSLCPIKLYMCPSEIIDINIIKTNNLSVLLSLAIGTIIKIPLNEVRNDVQIIHLNTAICKLYPIEDTVVYTDGNTMWKSEKPFTDCIKFKKCVIKQVKDFVIIRDKLLCTTFSNLIYLLSFNNGLFKELPTDAYCPADEVLCNSNCLAKIMNEVNKSNEIVQKIKKEETYITALSLSNRHDILDGVVNYNVTVLETFDDIPKADLTLIDNIKEYYTMGTLYFLINIVSKPLIDKFNELLSNMFGNLKIHLILASDTHCLKTITVNVGQLKEINIVVPLLIKKNNLNKMTVEIKLVTSITEVFDTKHVWTILHSKKIILNSEHFIKTYVPNDQLHHISDNECIDDTIYKTTVNHYGLLYKFDKLKSNTTNWSLYVKLTENYENLLNNATYFRNYFNARKAETLFKQITSDDFMKSKNEVVLEIGHDKLCLQIINDGFTKPILRVSCKNIEKAFHIRNFLSQLVHNNFTAFEPGKEFVDHALYSTVERFEKTFQDTINRLPFSRLEFIKLFEKYQKNVIGRLPL